MHFEADDEVCDECGALGSCPHSDDPLPNTAYGRPSAFMPAAHGPNSLDWQPPAALVGVDTVDMVARAPIMRGEEAWNSYGLMSNATLLTTYGFTLSEETEWERFSWEWRTSEEREAVLHALELEVPRMDHLESGESRKRRLSTTEAEEPSAKRRLGGVSDAPLHATLRSWVRLCAVLSGLSLTSFAELLAAGSLAAPEPTAASLLTLPVASPLSALARAAAATQSHQVQAGASDSDEESTLPAGLSSFLAPLSNHDGSPDERQPLFIDADGRISIVLWRSAVLAVMACSATMQERQEDPGEDEEQELRQKVERLESLLASAMASIEGAESLRIECSSAESMLLDRALAMVHDLARKRKEALRIARAGEEEAALCIIEVSEEAAYACTTCLSR